MSAPEFRPAVREAIPLLLGVAGGTGSGKTFSAMRLAVGIARVVAPGKRFCVIDTENGRSKHYADDFAFDVLDFDAPFSPARYQAAVEAADAAGYPVIVVDSTSHEHAGEGGILDMAEAELEELTKGDRSKEGQYRMKSWIRPKGEHKRFVRSLLRCRAHVILAFRAEEKIEMVREKGSDGRTYTVVKPKESAQKALQGWFPIAEKTLPFELTASFLLLADAPGVPRPIKLPAALRPFVGLDRVLDENVGAALAEWARGAKPAERLVGGLIGAVEVAKLGEAAKRRAAELGGDPDATAILKGALAARGFETRSKVTTQQFADVLELVENWSRGDGR